MQNSQEVWLKGPGLYFYLLLLLSNLAEVSLAHEGSILQSLDGVVWGRWSSLGAPCSEVLSLTLPHRGTHLCPPPPRPCDFGVGSGQRLMPLPCFPAWPEELTRPLPRCSWFIRQQRPGSAEHLHAPGSWGQTEPCRKEGRTLLREEGPRARIPCGSLRRLQGALRAAVCSIPRGQSSSLNALLLTAPPPPPPTPPAAQPHERTRA